MKLSNTKVLNAKPGEKNVKLADGHGLYLLITPKGKKSWRYDYRFEDKRKTQTYGLYPAVSITAARDAHLKDRTLLAKGIDPRAEKTTTEKGEKIVEEKYLFKTVTKKWLVIWKHEKAPRSIKDMNGLLERHIYSVFENKDIRDITSVEISEHLEAVQKTGKVETAHRIKSTIRRIYEYAGAKGLVDKDPTFCLKSVMMKNVAKRHPAVITPSQVGTLLQAMALSTARPVTYCALQLLPLVFLRPYELRAGRWSEVSFEERLWRVPEDRIKNRSHRPQMLLVPLADQTIKWLKSLYLITGGQEYMFPIATIKKERKTDAMWMSENTLNKALERVGYRGVMVGHGFRTTATTLLNEAGWNGDVVETQMCHIVGEGSRPIYNHAKWLESRRNMMQWWADYLDKLTLNAGDISMDDIKVDPRVKDLMPDL